MTVRVVTDSLTDIPGSMQQDLGIVSVPAIISFGEQSYRDKVDLTTDEFYRRLAESPTLPTTSQPPPATFQEVYSEIGKSNQEIISIHSTAALTGIYSSALTASQSLPELKISVANTRAVSMAAGWIVVIAARAARAGATLAQLKEIVDDTIPRSHVIAALDTLIYAQRGGRLGRAQVLLGTLLNVKPILSMKDGVVEPVENVRSQKRAIDRLAQIVLESGPIQEISVNHAAALSSALALKQIISQTLDSSRIVISETGPAIGAHVGPNTVGACWVNSKS